MTTTAEQQSAYLLRQMLQKKSTAELKALARIYALDLVGLWLERQAPERERLAAQVLTEVIDELRYRATH